MDDTDNLLEFMTWKDHDRKTIPSGHYLLGVTALNKLSNDIFLKQLHEYAHLVIYKNIINEQKVIWKHDINNGILTPLQLNKNLLPEKYELINVIRELLWKDNNEYLNDEETEQIFS